MSILEKLFSGKSSPKESKNHAVHHDTGLVFDERDAPGLMQLAEEADKRESWLCPTPEQLEIMKRNARRGIISEDKKEVK